MTLEQAKEIQQKHLKRDAAADLAELESGMFAPAVTIAKHWINRAVAAEAALDRASQIVAMLLDEHCGQWCGWATIAIQSGDLNGEILSTPAGPETRAARRRAHAAFDAIWKSGALSRKDAYQWLAVQMGLSLDDCHIGYFDAEQCARMVKLIEERMAQVQS